MGHCLDPVVSLVDLVPLPLKVAADERTDLIVMGVRGRGAVDLLLFGSNTARVARAAECPVLIIPG